MGSQYRSISQRLAKAKALETKQEILRDWSNSWDREVNAIIDDLGNAIARDDFDRASQCIGELRAVHRKKMDGLKSIFGKIKELS